MKDEERNDEGEKCKEGKYFVNIKLSNIVCITMLS